VTETPALVLRHDGDVLEGEGIVAVAKPPGEPVIPARGEAPDACLQRRLERQLRRQLWVVHRIDRDASGVVLFATDANAQRALSIAFEQRRVTKSYRAFTAGELTPPSGRLELTLHGARKGKTRPAAPGEPGQKAVTDYVTLETWRLGEDRVALVEASPLTGRHHQIRVHLRAAGAPILFDSLYARGRTPAALAAAPCSRLALHALRIEIPAPRGKARLAVEAPLAADLVALARWLAEAGAR
jgi:tRNA pseudouridine32 synthase/23S rRNA pseudouridine746 synthase/23S rRNA pseudouridine955/2504/2580 synthase